MVATLLDAQVLLEIKETFVGVLGDFKVFINFREGLYFSADYIFISFGIIEPIVAALKMEFCSWTR